MHLKYQYMYMEFDDLSTAPGVPENILEVVPLEYINVCITYPLRTSNV